MFNIYEIVNKFAKSDLNEFVQSIVEPIGNLCLGREASVNEIITSYVKESTLCKLDDEDDIGNAYLSVALLLAFFERLSSPLRKPSSFEEIIDTENFSTEDMIAECTGIVAQSIFEGDEDRADEYLLCMAVLTKKLLEEEGYDFPDENPALDEEGNPNAGGKLK